MRQYFAEKAAMSKENGSLLLLLLALRSGSVRPPEPPCELLKTENRGRKSRAHNILFPAAFCSEELCKISSANF